MLSADDRLLGWLCILRANYGTRTFKLPAPVRAALAARGWVRVSESGMPGVPLVTFTELGVRESDLAGPEWGIDPLLYHAGR